MTIMPSFGEVLKKLMRERGISARALSKETGIPASTLSEWSAGREPKLSEATVKLARYFGVSLEYLAVGEEPESKLIKEILNDSDEDFFVVHRGVYRLTVEKSRKTKRKD